MLQYNSYEELCLAFKENRLELTRTKETEQKYEQHKKELQEQGIQKHDHIMELIELEGCFMSNAFPYILPKDCVHYLYWDLENLSLEDLEVVITENVGHLNFIFFKNPTHKQSVPTIPHYQVIVKEKVTPEYKLDFAQEIVEQLFN